MPSDITLTLREDFLPTDAIILEAPGYDPTPREDFVRLDRDDDSDLMISVHRETGEILIIIVEQFKSETELAIQNLRDNPLPWTFSLPELNIREKPLADILEAIFRKYRNIKLIGD